jgi:hypothetical protein
MSACIKLITVLADPQCLADLPVAQSKRVPQPKHLAHLPHRQSLSAGIVHLCWLLRGFPIRSSTGMPFRLCLSAVRNHQIAVRLPSDPYPRCVGFRNWVQPTWLDDMPPRRTA